jgi:hypothetical protein
MPNSYQRAKARKIAAVLIQAAAQSDTPFSQLPGLAARMSEDQWRTVAFQAGQSVADKAARVFTIGILLSIYGV